MSFGHFIKKACFKSLVVGVVLSVFGTSIAIGAWVYIKNVIQGEVVTVPDLLGLTTEEARKRIENLDLVFKIDEGQKVFSHVIKKDRVYLQVPRPERKIKTGRIVEVTISAGPEEKLIPNLMGETLNFSRTLLKEVGREPDIISRTPSTLRGRGRVLAQNPQSGAPPDLSRSTALLVSDGQQYPSKVTPDFRGKDYAEVKAFLDRHEFRIVTKYRAEEEGLGPVVLHQEPEPGFAIDLSQTITLIVNKDF